MKHVNVTLISSLQVVAALFVLWGCGGGDGAAGITVTIAPPSATVIPGQQQTFTPTVSNANSSAVVWSIQEGAAGGSISNAGVYTAPGAEGTYHVVATSVEDPTKAAVATVTVPLIVGVSPPNVVTTVGAKTQFTSSIQGSGNTGVNWSVQEGAAGGSITTTGEYTAPGVPGTFHAVATSLANPLFFAVATVTVQAGGAQIIVD